MTRVGLLALALVSASCHTGDHGENCNKDGTCNAPALHCLSGNCWAAPPPERVPRRCTYESECYCVTCADKCGAAGMKTCAFSDTSVWGAQPAVCECYQ